MRAYKIPLCNPAPISSFMRRAFCGEASVFEMSVANWMKMVISPRSFICAE